MRMFDDWWKNENTGLELIGCTLRQAAGCAWNAALAAHDEAERRCRVNVKITKKDRACFEHLLIECKANKIAEPNSDGGHYYGNRQQYIKRHLKTIKLLESVIKELKNG